jgi:hypothetical protein
VTRLRSLLTRASFGGASPQRSPSTGANFGEGSPRRWPVILLSLVFLALHLPYLPASLEDLDSINFALGLRQFDVAHHQPHPPGYPVFMLTAKAVHAVVPSGGGTRAGQRRRRRPRCSRPPSVPAGLIAARRQRTGRWRPSWS